MEKMNEGSLPQHVYFVGAGGIGMANLVRYCLANGIEVAGYDRTSTPLTDALIAEDAQIIFEDDAALIPGDFIADKELLVVYTPAVPADNRILTALREAGHEPVKRAVLLGRITRGTKAICVAGSHGKTTTSSMIAHILDGSGIGCNAFLGGILRNNGSNLILSADSPYSVVEADEYDRSFHQLSPWLAVITSTDPDHLDIYGNEENYLESFAHFTELIRPGGKLLLHTGLKIRPRTGNDVTVETYSAAGPADWRATDVTYGEGTLTFTLNGPGRRIEGISLGVPVEINIDNAVAAGAAACAAGATDDDVRRGLSTFLGAKRRFEFWIKERDHVLIDDYAHSPAEVAASIRSVRKLFPGRRLSVIFQPHLYTRTRDFASEFGKALSAADEVILPEIYPAREEPIEGVSSQLILDAVENCDKKLCERKDLLGLIKKSNFDILMTLGAADIDRLLPDIKRILTEK